MRPIFFYVISRSLRFLSLWVLVAVPVWSAPASPDWVKVSPSDEPGLWVVSWPSVPGADGYQIYLEIGATVEGDSPAVVLARWGYIEQQEGVIQVEIATLSEETISFGVSTVKDGEESEITWPAPIIPPSPESVWVEEYGEGFVILAWIAVPEADGYKIYREVVVTTAVNDDGELVVLETPEFVWVYWTYVEQQDSEIIRASIPTTKGQAGPNQPDGPITPTEFAVAADRDGVASQIIWPVHPDFNRDGKVDLVDFFLFSDAYGTTLWRFDLDRDGRVDFDDYFLFANAFQGL